MQCNDIISNIVFIRMFFTLFSNRMISFFTLQCELFTSCNVSNNASLVSARTGGGGWSTKCGQAWTGGGGTKNYQICADILHGWPLMRTGRRSFTILSPDPLKIFELNVYFDNQIMSSLWDIFIFLHNTKSKFKRNIVKSEKISLKVFFKKLY